MGFDMQGKDFWDLKNQTLKYASATSSSVWPYRSNMVG